MEVDLLAEERTTGERIIVECKAQRSTVPADVLVKLFGKVALEGFASGWLISTHDLGKDAKGVRDKFSARSPEERRRLQVYDPDTLLSRLISAAFLFDPARLAAPAGHTTSTDVFLLLAQEHSYWALIGIDDQTRMRRAVFVYDAHNGERVTARGVLTALAAADSSLATLTWEADDNTDRSRETQRIKLDLQSVVRVQPGDNWTDYRPARPQDYVGRENLLRDIADLLEKVRNRTTSTRVFAIKGPSGWGKSSSVLKLADMTRYARRGRDTFIYAVDSRAASSRRFVELALYRAIKEAVDSGFVQLDQELTIGGPNAPFSTVAAASVFRQLKSRSKVICLIFDQFEELLYKEDLAPIFEDVRLLCDSAIDHGENFIVGFSWKTDGAIPPEHNAYHLWHTLADRRREFELGLFSTNEVTVAINRFSKELGEPISPQLRRLLLDHCQGYPWLLKKLCIHILEQIRNGLDQSEVLSRTLRIEDLFAKDIERLTEAELACIRQIAAEAPAEFFKMVAAYGELTITSLLDKRLIVRTGSRLSIYWDIFREYLLTEKVPYIPTTYVPQLNVVTYLSALRALLRQREMTYQALARELKITAGTADNLVRDMVVVGHAEANRKTGQVTALHTEADAASVTLLNFCRSHVIYRSALERFGVETEFSLQDAVDLAVGIYSRLRLSQDVIEQYARRVLQWCVAAGTLDRVRDSYIASNALVGVSGLTANGARNRRGRGFFLGDAPPERAEAALRGLIEGRLSRDELVQAHGDKAFATLCALGLIDNRGALLVDPCEQPSNLIRAAARENPALHLVRDTIRENPRVTGQTIGERLALELGAVWTAESRQRNGNAVRRWVGWTWPDDFEWRGRGVNRRLHERAAAGELSLFAA